MNILISPPTDVKHTVNLLPQDTTRAEKQAVVDYLHDYKSTFTQSADVAWGLMFVGTPESIVYVWDGERWNGDIFAWLTEKGITYIKKNFSDIMEQPGPGPDPIPPTGEALIGLHASADPPITDPELQEFKDLIPGMIKVMSSNDPDGVAKLARQHPGTKWVVRAFLDWGGRNITPEQFYDWTFSDVLRTITVINVNGISQKDIVVELHNEPNLSAEGLGYSWNNGREFAKWWLPVLDMYRLSLPSMKFIYPGLSPGISIPNVRQNDRSFVQESMEAVYGADGLGVHSYWAWNAPMSWALSELDWYIDHFKNTPIYITEASNNKEGTPVVKGKQYAQFWQELLKRPTVRGVTFFVASSIDPKYQEEVWVGKGIGELVRWEIDNA